jgi:hypothetical protein
MLFGKIEAGPRMDFTICGDTNYLTDSDRKKELDAMLIFSNLSGTVYFPTRIHNQSRSAIDNIFFDVSKFENYTIYRLLGCQTMMLNL